MSQVYITRREEFSAAHRLYQEGMSDEENLELFGKCVGIHGHNYVLEVTIAGNVQEQTGCVLDLKDLKKIIHREIIQKVDHLYLNNDVEFLRGMNPTAENIVLAFWKVLEPKIPKGRLYAVRLHETENNMAEYRGE